MGDVEKGAIIKAGGNIIVLGRLYGQALAGNNPDVKEPFIMANDFFPDRFLSDVLYESLYIHLSHQE